MTGIYLFNKDRKPTEIEHLTKEERKTNMAGRGEEELLDWIDTLCENIIEIENFLINEGYEEKEK